eukprot:5194851-Heterocapsa_arctica.AAC.1
MGAGLGHRLRLGSPGSRGSRMAPRMGLRPVRLHQSVPGAVGVMMTEGATARASAPTRRRSW